MQEHLPWLSQGDIFAEIPILAVRASATSDTVEADHSSGPALLITQGCTLDKASNAGRPTNKRLHFLPLVSVIAQDKDRQALLRRNAIKPYDVLYLGDCGSAGEAFAVLGEIVYIPAEYFDPVIDTWHDHPASITGNRYCTPRRHSTRLGRLDDAQLDLLLDKMNAFWTRRIDAELPEDQLS